MEGFEDIETVNLTRDVPIEPPAKFLIHWTVLLDNKKLSSKGKMINPTTFDYAAFLAKEHATTEYYARRKGYRVQRQRIRAGLSYNGVKKQDTMILDLEDVEGWANLEAIVLAWHDGKKKGIQVSIDIKYARKAVPMHILSVSTDNEESESSEEEETSSRRKKVSQLLPVGLID